MSRWPAADDRAAFVVPEERAGRRRDEPPWPPQDPARVARVRAERGLPADPATVRGAIASSQVWDELPLTTVERELQDEFEPVLRRVIALDSPEPLAGCHTGWRDGHPVMVISATNENNDIVNRLRDELGVDRVVVDICRYSRRQLEDVSLRIHRDRQELDALAGIDVWQSRVDIDSIEIHYLAPDRGRAEALLRQRYGDVVHAMWDGPNRMRETPHPFATWTADADSLTVFYALDHNGQQPCGCRVEEHEDRVLVHLTILEPQGLVTLIGGYKPTHATVQLAAPLGERPILDASCATVRPRWRPLDTGTAGDPEPA